MRRVHHGDLPRAVGEEFVIDGDEAHHMLRVLRARAGDVFGVFDGRGREVDAEVIGVSRRDVSLRVAAERVPRRAAREVVLCAAVPRGQRMESLVEKCTEAGVARIVPLRTARGVRDGASANHMRRWRRAALEAAKQCGRADVPAVDDVCELADALASLGGVPVLLADPGATGGPADAAPGDGRVAVVIGPEGGFDDDERAQIVAAGAIRFGLGPLILRIETAAIVAVHALASHVTGREARESDTPS